MRFKDWFFEQDGLGGTSMTGGGASIQSLVGTNSNMPFGVKSKYVTKDADEPDQQNNGKDRPNPDFSFGFQTPKQKKQPLESQPNVIDKSRKAVPIRDDNMFVTY